MASGGGPESTGNGGAPRPGRRRGLQTTSLKPDMTANVTVNIGTRHNVLIVPAEAVKQTLKGATVTVMTHNNGKVQIQVKQVRTGASDGVNTEIRSGLNEGEVVVRAGLPTSSGPNGQRSAFGSPSGGGGGGGRGMH